MIPNYGSDKVRLPKQEWDRVLTGLAVHANIEEYRKDNPEKARSIRDTARGIARQLNTASDRDVVHEIGGGGN